MASTDAMEGKKTAPPSAGGDRHRPEGRGILAAVLIATVLVVASAARAGAAVYDVRSFGAAGDGRSLDTVAINRAIDAAAAKGGGTVEFPAGEYRCFSIRLKSHVTLLLDNGATIVAAEPPADLSSGYDDPEPNAGTDQYQDFGHSHWRNSLIWGEGLENVAIVGPGRIYGFGLSRGWDRQRRDFTVDERRLPEDHRPKLALAPPILPEKAGPFGYPGEDTLPAGVGNKSIALKNCRNVIFRDFTILHGGHFAILATGVDNWTCDHITIDTNRDGIDVDACANVRLSNCAVNSPDDDAIVLKASYALGRLRPTENVSIVNCEVSGYEEGTLVDGTRLACRATRWGEPPIGRIKLGTEANGGFRNITISNCTFDHCRGLALEQVDGGVLEDVVISNLAMRHIGNAPIYLRLGARLRGPAPISVGTLRRIKISNVIAHDVARAGGILLLGVRGHAIEDVTLENIFIDYVGGGTARDALRSPPEDEADYPEPSRHGLLPSWGFYGRHVQNLVVRGVELRTASLDLRPPVQLEDAEEVRLEGNRFPPANGVPPFVFKDVRGLSPHVSP